MQDKTNAQRTENVMKYLPNVILLAVVILVVCCGMYLFTSTGTQSMFLYSFFAGMVLSAVGLIASYHVKPFQSLRITFWVMLGLYVVSFVIYVVWLFIVPPLG